MGSFVMPADEKPIYVLEEIAKSLRKPVSLPAFKRMRKHPDWDFILVGSMSNAYGGRGVGAYSYQSSLDAAWDKWYPGHAARVSEVRRKAGSQPWPTDTSSGSAW